MRVCKGKSGLRLLMNNGRVDAFKTLPNASPKTDLWKFQYDANDLKKYVFDDDNDNDDSDEDDDDDENVDN